MLHRARRTVIIWRKIDSSILLDLNDTVATPGGPVTSTPVSRTQVTAGKNVTMVSEIWKIRNKVKYNQSQIGDQTIFNT
jgi:hypothetical protein